MSLRADIERRLAELLATTNPRPGWVWRREVALTHQPLTLYSGWTCLIGIRPDGSLAVVADEPASVRPVDGVWARIALAQGARLYPELAPLVPARPDNAERCPTCDGSGVVAAHPDLLCACGGLGWVMPGESLEWRW